MALAVVVLTVPVFLGLAQIDVIPEWLYSECGYAVLRPLFVTFGAFGVEGYEDVVAGVLLAGSVLVALAIVGVWVGVGRIRCRTNG